MLGLHIVDGVVWQKRRPTRALGQGGGPSWRVLGEVAHNSPSELRCPSCDKPPGACVLRNQWWEMEWCEQCGWDAPMGPPAGLDFEDLHLDHIHEVDIYDHREEARRLHEAQV